MSHLAYEPQILVEDPSSCPICGEEQRTPLYRALCDRLFGAPGEWGFDCCVNCGCAYLNPRPISTDILKVYTEAYADRKPITQGLSKRSGWVGELRSAISSAFLANALDYPQEKRVWPRILAGLVHLSPHMKERLFYKVLGLRFVPGGRLLDVGCGNGDSLIQLSAFGWDVEGIDTNPAMVQVCKERGLRVIQGILEAQNFPSDTFDAITVKHVIEHVYDPLGFLKECHRILKPKGQLMILTPNIRSIGHFLFTDAWLGLDAPRHLVVFTSDSLRLAAQQANLEVKSCRSTARITSFNWRVSYGVKVRKRTGYRERIWREEVLVEYLADAIVRLAILVNKQAGDELALVATK